VKLWEGNPFLKTVNIALTLTARCGKGFEMVEKRCFTNGLRGFYFGFTLESYRASTAFVTIALNLSGVHH
jgi:hypothetical protein